MQTLGQVNHHSLLAVSELEESEVLYRATLNKVCASISARKTRRLGIVAFESGGFYPRVSTLDFVLGVFQAMKEKRIRAKAPAHSSSKGASSPSPLELPNLAHSGLLNNG